MAELRRTRFVCISDTHNGSPLNGSFKLPKGDVLIHAGDMTNQGSRSELSKTINWIERADFEVKIVVAGMLGRLVFSGIANEQAITTSHSTKTSIHSMAHIFIISTPNRQRNA